MEMNFRGSGGGSGRGQGSGGGGGRKGGFGKGAGGNFICPFCGPKVPHKGGVPCNSLKCPQCGTVMTRE